MNKFCEENAIDHITTPAYAPWTNGLIENSNKILLGRLKQMCVLDLDDAEANNPDPESTLTQWTDHLDAAICSMNNRILPALGFTPRELLWGRRETSEERPKAHGETETKEQDAMYHFAFSDLLHSQAYTGALAEAARRKAIFDDKVHPVEFKPGDLVQIYNSKLDVTYETKAKLLPCWSPPRIITDQLLNLYTLC